MSVYTVLKVVRLLTQCSLHSPTCFEILPKYYVAAELARFTKRDTMVAGHLPSRINALVAIVEVQSGQ